MTAAAKIAAGTDPILERQGANANPSDTHQVRFHNISYANGIRRSEAVQDVFPLRIDVT